MASTPETALLAAVAVHLGFQLTVTTMVYPALFRAPDWEPAHSRHSRSITPVVVVVYAGLVTAAAWTVIEGIEDMSTLVALAGVALSLATTALVAAPLHARLAHGRDAVLLRRLAVADSVRTGGAVLAMVGALLATR